MKGLNGQTASLHSFIGFPATSHPRYRPAASARLCWSSEIRMTKELYANFFSPNQLNPLRKEKRYGGCLCWGLPLFWFRHQPWGSISSESYSATKLWQN